ncbi:MAG TPA: choice-of-anchor D domain-containing protein [Kofleriaceae bacterium]|nr:choice-of-anchor D domain-containing protein [Kofleriaceae bacterium]
MVVFALASARGATAAPPAFHAEPEVQVIELAVGGSASGTILLRNDSTSSIVAGSITAEPGCDAAQVHASPLTGFTLAAGATRALTIMCTPAPASMQRCGYRVRSPAGTVLAELEAVCAYAEAPSLLPDTTAIDFGTVVVGGSASQTVALHNTSATSLTTLFVEATDFAGNFTVAAPCNPDARACDAAIAAVPAGGTTNLTISCTPRAVGVQTAQLYLATSAGTRLAAPISLTCTGMDASVPVIATSPSAIDVGVVEVVGATATTTVHVTNAGVGLLKLLALQIVDGGTGAATDWTYTARTPCSSGIPPTCTVASGQTADLDLTLDPSAIGVRDATLLITYHDTADRSTSVPLHGVGGGATLDLVAGPTTFDFGTLPLNVTGTLTFQVANRGTRNLSDGAVALMPAGPPFTVAPSPVLAVSTAAPATITIACTPTVAGTFMTSLALSAPDVQGPLVDLTLRCAGDPAEVLIATPPAVLLGEVRTMTQLVQHVAVTSTSGPVSILSAGLEIAQPSLTVNGAPATTPATLDLTAAPRDDGSLSDRILVRPSSGPALAIPVTGAAVTAAYNAPDVVSLGTFCVQQPTTPRILALSSTGTATIGLSAPVLQSSDSPFDLQLVAPLTYPTILGPTQRALVAATPKRQAVAGLASDDLIWTTDVTDARTHRTKLTATFVDNGGAIAPPALAFGTAPIHLDTRNAQQVTLQNCDVASLQLDPPLISAPFSIDSPNFPNVLLPGETATFSVGFHPTKRGAVTKLLVITSPQRRNEQLTVTLTGEGIATGGNSDAGPPTTRSDHTSFYACDSCTSNEPSSTIALALAALSVLVPRRRR